MRSIEANYKNIEKKNPSLGTYPCIAYAVWGKNFSRDTIARFFPKVMPGDEYDKYTKNDYIDQLHTLSNKPLKSTKWEKDITPKGSENEELIYE
jgi:hypothetical protein